MTPTWADFADAWPLFRDPLLCGAAAGAVLGVLGVFVVLRRQVFFTAALTQSAGMGVAFAFFAQIHWGWGLPPVAGAFLACGLTALVANLRAERLHLSPDSLLALLWLLSGALALILGDRIAQEAHDISSILFGTAVLVSEDDLRKVLGVGAVVLAATFALRKGLIFAGFDREGARVQGVPVRALDLTLLLLLTAEVAVATQALGALPVFAYSVLPGMAALLFLPSMRWAFPLAFVLGAVSGALGYVAAFFYDLPVGGAQALVAGLFVVLGLGLRSVVRAP